MDTGEGRFEQFTSKDADEYAKKLDELRGNFPKSKGVFTVGEQLEIKGSLFEVKDISPYGIKLRLLPQP